MKIYPLLLALTLVIIIIALTGCSRHAVEGKCYQFSEGHIKKITIISKVLKVQDGYLLYQFCDDFGCMAGLKSSVEKEESEYLDTFSEAVECPIDLMRY